MKKIWKKQTLLCTQQWHLVGLANPQHTPLKKLVKPAVVGEDDDDECWEQNMNKDTNGDADNKDCPGNECRMFTFSFLFCCHCCCCSFLSCLEGYILIFLKALYGLKSSGKRWAEVIHGILRDMKFLPSKADPYIWLRKAPNLRCYEYIAVYVDDLCIAAESPSAIIQIFKSKYHLKVKGDGKLTYHMGADYFEDPDGTFVSQPKKYIDNLADTYKRLFNEDPPKGYKTPLDKNDHPELDTSEILEGDMAAKYLTMVGQLQWLVTLGRFDIHAQVATMSRFRAAPRQGHMDRLKRIYSYAIRTKDYAIRFRTDQPDYSFLPDQDFDWTYSVYGNVQEILPDDMPDPLGKAVTPPQPWMLI